MGGINYCPIVRGPCNKSELEIKVQKDTFFLAEPFEPEAEKKRRGRAVKNALKEVLDEEFSEKSLRVADQEPKEPAIFCDICCLIQSSDYGIVDISGLNPNVVLQLGMMLSLGKPVFVLMKRNEEEDLRKKFPSDIIWEMAIPYEEFIDIEEELPRRIQNCPHVEPVFPMGEEAEKVFAETEPSRAQAVDAEPQEIKRDQEEKLKNLEELLKEAGLSETISREKEIEIPLSLEKQIDDVYKEIEEIERLAGYPENPEIAFLVGNWHYHRKEYDRAVELYDLALTLKPDFHQAWANKGVTLDKLDRHGQALEAFDKAIELKPDYTEALAHKGVVLDEVNLHEEPVEVSDKVVELRPDDTEDRAHKDVALDEVDLHEEPVEASDKVVELKPDDAEVWYNKGVALAKDDLHDQALEAFDKAIGLEPDYAEAWYNRACVYSLKEDKENALGNLSKAIELDAKYKESAEQDEDFKNLWDDEDFKKLLG